MPKKKKAKRDIEKGYGIMQKMISALWANWFNITQVGGNVLYCQDI